MGVVRSFDTHLFKSHGIDTKNLGMFYFCSAINKHVEKTFDTKKNMVAAAALKRSSQMVFEHEK